MAILFQFYSLVYTLFESESTLTEAVTAVHCTLYTGIAESFLDSSPGSDIMAIRIGVHGTAQSIHIADN